jgi:hypothetical protein
MKESLDFESAHERKHQLLTGIEKPRNEGEHQMILMTELFTRDHPSEVMRIGDRNFESKMLQYWIDNKYAKAFRDLVEHPDFKSKKQYRLSGNVFNVTLSDVEFFLHNNELPER